MQSEELSPAFVALAKSAQDAAHRAYGLAQRRWPELPVSFASFQEAWARHALAPGELDGDHAADLLLACACAENVPGALRRFREHYAPVVASAVRSFDESNAFAEEVYQRLSETLFVDRPERPAKIHRYSGRGALAGFVATSARRIALRLTAAAAPFQGEEALIQHFSAVHEHETAMLKQRHRETFNRALSVALRQLPRRDRLVLRMNVIERVSTTRIAVIYKVSQPTVSRWLQRAAQTIFATVKELICDELDIDTRELESLLLLVRSQIEISIAGSLNTVTSEEPE